MLIMLRTRSDVQVASLRPQLSPESIRNDFDLPTDPNQILFQRIFA
jgi:hypothetical protein